MNRAGGEMIIGVPKEIKDNEFRVAMTPAGVEALKAREHTVLVQAGAGEGSGIGDRDYERVGADIVASAADAWGSADLVVKVKEPIEAEYGFLRDDLALFTYLHLAGAPGLAERMRDSGMTGIAYETVETADGRFPLLEPMSEVAGQLAVYAAAHYLQKASGGLGRLIGSVPGVAQSEVVVIGAGTVGQSAARLAMACGANVTLINRSAGKLREFLARGYPGSLRTAISSPAVVAEAVMGADVVIGAVYVGGARAAWVVTRDMVRSMRPGSVIVDVAIDQGGSVETSRPTSYSDPVFVEHGVVHYCVANMPGAVPRTSSYALTNATLPYVAAIAGKGAAAAASVDPALARGVNVYQGRLTNGAVAKSLGMDYTPLDRLLP
jgi:alanine dehydrogenase